MRRKPQDQSIAVPPTTQVVPIAVFFAAVACNGGSLEGDGDGRLDEEPAMCPYTYQLPEVTGCDGVLMTAEEWITDKTSGVTETTGPLGLPALRFDDEQSIDLKRKGCLQLAKDGADFSVSLWFKAPRPEVGDRSFQILSAGVSQYGGDHGFMLMVDPSEERPRAKLIAKSGPRWETINSVEFDYDSWTRLTLTYTSHGDVAHATLMVNDAMRGGSVPADIYNSETDTLRLGDEGFGSIAPFEIADLRSYGRVLGPREIRAQTLAGAEALGMSADALAGGLASLRGHVSGKTPLGTVELDAAVASVTKNAAFLPTQQALIVDALDLLDLYETTAGPLFINEATKSGFPDVPQPGEPDAVRDARAMADVFQIIHDEVYRSESVAACRDVLAGRRWATADHFPGVVTATVDPSAPLRVLVDATVPPAWGRPVAWATDSKLRPTGVYLPPGSIGRVTVPPELVGKGFVVQVGAHVQDFGHHSERRRLDRVTRRFEIEHEVTYVGSPLGGGIYIEVPYRADAGLVDVEIENAVEAPFYSTRSFDATTPEQWKERRTAGVPWSVFVTDYYMIHVPTNWVYAKDDPSIFLRDWDISLQAFSESQGIPPEERNDVVLYMGTDVNILGSGFGIGYPQINNTYEPRGDEGGDSKHMMVNNPLEAAVDFHELGHAQLQPGFRGETETLIEVPATYIMNTRFDYDLDRAFAWSSFGTDSGFTPDRAAQDWMVTENFRNGAEMDHSNTTKDEFRYQHRGRGKYIDIVRLFGWKVFTDFNHQEHLDYMDQTPSDGLDETDSRILRLSVAAGEDLTPLIHFWGIHPVDADALRDQMDDKGLTASTAQKNHLLRYHDFIPDNKAEFLMLFEALFPGMPAGESPDYGPGWYHVQAETYDEAKAQRAHDALNAVVALYFP